MGAAYVSVSRRCASSTRGYRCAASANSCRVEESAMKSRVLIAIGASGVLCAAGYGLYSIGVEHGTRMTGQSSTVPEKASVGAQRAGEIDPAAGKKVLYWHDPMVPGQKFDK